MPESKYPCFRGRNLKTITEVFEKLLKHYGPQNWWPAESKFEVVVGAVLTQNTSWKNVEKAIDNLKKANLMSPDGILKTPEPELAELLKPSGYPNLKARRLKNTVSFINDRWHLDFDRMKKLSVELLRQSLLKINGVGEETADSIILYAVELPTFVIDAYTKRLFSRLGIINGREKYEEVKRIFDSNLPRDVYVYQEYHALIVVHCKEKCRKKPLCKNCPLAI